MFIMTPLPQNHDDNRHSHYPSTKNHHHEQPGQTKHQSNNKVMSDGRQGGDGTWRDEGGNNANVREGRAARMGVGDKQGRDGQGRDEQPGTQEMSLDISWVIGFLFLFAFD